jgi:hypothetical protein
MRNCFYAGDLKIYTEAAIKGPASPFKFSAAIFAEMVGSISFTL